MKKAKFFALFSMLLLLAIGSNAQVTQPGRIRQGTRSGEITRHERKRLVRQQRKIHRDVRTAKADGVITAGEKTQIKKEKRRANKNIYRKKHNRRETI